MFSGNERVSNTVFILIITLLALVGLAEFYGMARRRGLICFHRLGIAAGVLLVAGTFWLLTGRTGAGGSAPSAGEFESIFFIAVVLGLGIRMLAAQSEPRGIAAFAVTFMGLMYVPWLLNFIQRIQFFPGINGTFYVLYFILVTKFSDTGAYGVGSLLGRHKMIPRISPGKTWEGFAGALLVPLGVSVLFAHLAGDRLAGMTLAHAACLGVVLGLGAVTGDLIESMIKREAGVKDSGGYFPGIGGILDLLDSLLFNAPLMYLYLRYVLAPSGQTPALPGA
jgi:phosphatidate cytidylyltransferase